MRNFQNGTGKILRDADSQLDFIISGRPETVCDFENVFRAEVAPNTFIRYREKVDEELVTTTTTKPVQLEGILIKNWYTKKCLGSVGPPSAGGTVSIQDCDTSRAETFMFVRGKLISSVDATLCLGTDGRNDTRRVVYRKCTNKRSEKEDWVLYPDGKIKLEDQCLTLMSKFPIGTNSWKNSPFTAVNLLKCGDLTNMSTYQEWNLTSPRQGSKIAIGLQGDDPRVGMAETDEAAHRQYEDDLSVDMVNALNDEIRSIYCEAFRTKEFVAITLAQTNPMLAGVVLGLPACQRVQAFGQIMSIQQCKALKVKIGAEKTRCGWEPKFGEFSIGKDGYTRVDFRPCLWGGFANLNGRAYEFADGKSWKHIPSNVKLANIGLKTHFDESVDNEVQYLKNLETSFHIVEMDQINMIGKLMALMQHEDINSISPIIMHTQSESQVGKFSNWITGFKTTGIVILGIAIVVGIIFCWLKCCPNVTCNCKEGNGGGNNNRRFEQSYPMNFFPSAPAAETSSPLYPALNSPTVSPSPQTARHSHVHITLGKNGRYVYEDGCRVTLNQSPIRSIPEEAETANL